MKRRQIGHLCLGQRFWPSPTSASCNLCVFFEFIKRHSASLSTVSESGSCPLSNVTSCFHHCWSEPELINTGVIWPLNEWRWRQKPDVGGFLLSVDGVNISCGFTYAATSIYLKWWKGSWAHLKCFLPPSQSGTQRLTRRASWRSRGKVLMEADCWRAIIAWVTGGIRADTHSGLFRVPQATSELPLQVVYLHRGGAPAAVTHPGNKRAKRGEEEELCPHRYFCSVFTWECHGGRIPAACSK